MRIDFLRSAVAAGLALHLAAGMGLPLAAGQGFAGAAAPAIGVVVTSGAFRLNHATVRSNATLFEGAMVEAGAAPARLALTSGAQLELETTSAGRVFGRHLALDHGAVRIDRAAGSASGFSAGFSVEARGLTIQPDASGSTGRIWLIGERRVEVSALTGSFRALNSQGMLIAKIVAGRSLALEPQLMPGRYRITGRLLRREGHFLLTDETTNVTVEVAGSVLSKPDFIRLLGQRAEFNGFARRGATPVSDAAQVVEVAQVTPAPPQGSAPAGPDGAGGTAPAGAGGTAGGASGGAGGGASGAAVSVTMIAIIGGVAAAAVVGGLAASGNLGGSTAPPVSR